MRTLLPYYSLLAMVGMMIVPLLAQSPTYLRYTTEDGLPTNYVYGVIEDADGVIWAYTENGLAKFDGYTFQHFSTADGLPGNDITWALRAPDGKIWLYVYGNRPAYLLKDSIYPLGDHPGSLIRLLPDGRPLYNSIKSGGGATYDTIYKALDVAHISPDEFDQFGSRWRAIQKWSNKDTALAEERKTPYYTTTKDSTTAWDLTGSGFIKHWLSPHQFLYTSAGWLHWQTREGWKRLPIGSKSLAPELELQHFPGQAHRGILYDKHGSGECFLFDLEKEEIQAFPLQEYGIMPRYYTNVSVQASSFWFMSDAGSVALSDTGELLQKLSWPAKEQAWRPLRPYTDRVGNVWQGTRNGGLLMIPFVSFAIRDRALPVSGNQYVKRLLRMPDDRLLGFAENGEIYEVGTDTIKRVFQPQERSLFRSAGVLEDQLLVALGRKTVLLTFSEEEARISDFEEVFGCRPTNFSYLNSNIRTIAYHPQRRHLYTNLAAQTGLFWNLNHTAAAHCQMKRLSETFTLFYAHPSTGEIYGGNTKGLFLLKEDRYSRILASESKLRNLSSLFGTPGKLWIGTESNGLFSYDTETGALEQVIRDESVRMIRADGEGGILAVTNHEILAVPLGSPTDFQRYGPKNGLPNYAINDVMALGDSALLVASSSGLYELQREGFSLPPLDSNTFQLRGIAANDKPVAGTDLPYTTTQLDFRFHLRAYASDGKITYRTRLSPLEVGWQESQDRFRRYTGLRPGKYQFEAEAIDVYGRTISLSPVEIHIRPALWQRGWFKPLLIIGILGAVVFMVIRRLNEAKRKLAAEQALNQRLASMELEALKAQMNPHFIFNALGSIQYFIQTQEVDLADDYLTRFASLMRQYLDSSRETLLPIDREVALLRNYTELEQMRFEELFNVELLVSDELLGSGFQVPTMMIQPFVENAINHGLSERRDGKGLLGIHFSQLSPEILSCTIRDNGIGRKRSSQHVRHGHQSRGMKIVQEKIDTLAAASLLEVDYTITDADPEDDSFPGTLVTLHFKSPDYAST